MLLLLLFVLLLLCVQCVGLYEARVPCTANILFPYSCIAAAAVQLTECLCCLAARAAAAAAAAASGPSYLVYCVYVVGFRCTLATI